MASSYQTWTEWKISSRGFHIIHLLRAFWKRLFWKRSASKFYQLLKCICKNIHRNKPCYIFRNFQGKSIWRNSFLVELHVALLKKGFLIDVSCRNISQFFLITFSKSTPALLYWNVLQSFSNFDTSSRWIVSEAAIQSCSLKLVVLGPRKMILAKSVINSWKWVDIQYSCN